MKCKCGVEWIASWSKDGQPITMCSWCSVIQEAFRKKDINTIVYWTKRLTKQGGL